MQTTSRRAPWNIASYSENIVLQALQFEKLSVYLKFPGGCRHKVIMDLVNALWRVDLMSAHKREIVTGNWL
jgi:hypothetical protein